MILQYTYTSYTIAFKLKIIYSDKVSFKMDSLTYERSFLRALSAFSLWICSMRMRLFLKTLPLALRYRLWYLEGEWSQIQVQHY